MRLIKYFLVFVLGVAVGSFFPVQSKQTLAKARNLIFSRERKATLAQNNEAPKETKKTTIKETAPETPKMAAKPQKAAPVYTVQVASFKELAQANKMVKELITKQYNAYIAPIDLQKPNGWYRVCIGESPTLQQAKAYQATIKSQFKDSFIQAF